MVRLRHHRPAARGRGGPPPHPDRPARATWSTGTYVGDAFTEATAAGLGRAADAALWAPDVRYVDGRYCMYYVVTQTTVDPRAATTTPSGWPPRRPRPARGPTPAARWSARAAATAATRTTSCGPSTRRTFTDRDGTQYLYYGSYYGGIFVTELTADGTRAVGEPTMVAIDNRYEGAYVVRHDGWYYLFASAGQLLRRPDHRLQRLRRPVAQPARPVRRPRRRPADRVPGRRHASWSPRTATAGSAPATTRSSPTWPARTGSSTTRIDRDDPYLDEPFGINERPMLLDRLDWIDGWPTVRAGAWASDGPQRGPGHRLGGRRTASSTATWPAGGPARGRTVAVDRTAGSPGRLPGRRPTCACGEGAAAAGLVTGWRTPARLRWSAGSTAEAGALVTDVVRGGDVARPASASRRCPAGFALRRLAQPGRRAARPAC